MPKNISNMRTACGYIRVSTDKQEELSPDAQKRLLIDYAKKNNISILQEHIFVEGGISGKKADKRPQFLKMIGMAKSKDHPFDVILVWKFSRFARNQEESIVYKSLLKKNNVEVVSVSEPLIEGPFGSLIERIIEWMDEYYSIRLSGEVVRGMTEKALRGGYQSTLPLGYTMNKDTGIPYIDDNADIVRYIYNQFLIGHSYLEIARDLNLQGHRTKRGATFEERTVKYILENPFYYGYVRWNRQKHDDHTIRDKSEWIVVPGAHEAIIPKETWDEVQEQIIKRKRPSKSRAPGTMRHWLGGIVKCSSCGSSLMTSNQAATHYQCGNYNRGSCSKSHYIKTKALEEAVYTAFEQVMASGNLRFELRRQSESDAPDTATIINAKLKKLEDKERRIKQAYRDGIDTLEEYKENKVLLQAERDELMAALDNIEPAEDATAEMLQEICSVYDIIKDDNQDKLTRANALRSVVDKMIWDKDNEQLEVYFYLVK